MSVSVKGVWRVGRSVSSKVSVNDWSKPSVSLWTTSAEYPICSEKVSILTKSSLVHPYTMALRNPDNGSVKDWAREKQTEYHKQVAL